VSRLLAAPATLMLVAGVLVAGALAGEVIARLTRFPRVVGYTLAGWVAVALGVGVKMPLEGDVRLIVELALALLLFEIGTRVRLRWLLRNRGLLLTSLLEAVSAAAAVFVALTALDQTPAVALACALLAMPASTAVAGRVALELDSDGQVTQRMSVLTALNTMYGVAALIAMQAVLVAGQADDWVPGVEAVLRSGGIAVVLAGLLAAAVTLAVSRLDLRHESAALLLLGLVLLAVAAARWLGSSPLLVPLLAGLLLRNVSERAWVWPHHFGSAGGVLVLLLFVIVGASWSPAALAAGGAAALALILSRGLAKGVSVLLLARASRLGLRQGFALAVTLTPLSATALVMLSDLMRVLPALGGSVAPIIVTAVAVLELLGPIAVRMALSYAGEDGSKAAQPQREST
jgi:Kef-type K+ transport system membrane component KefB